MLEREREIIHQCSWNGYGAGSWQAGSEFYSLSTTSISFRKRDTDVDSLPELPEARGAFGDITLKKGSYQLGGVPIDLGIADSPFAYQPGLDKCSGDLQATQGLVDDWTLETEQIVDLKAVIETAVLKAQSELQTIEARSNDTASHRLARRSQICRVERREYALVDAGYWYPGFELASGCYRCGRPSTSSNTISWDKSWSESFSVGIGSAAQDAARAAAINLGYTSIRTSSQGGSSTCDWDQTTWQRGWAVSAFAGEWYSAVWVNLIHGDAPATE